MTPEEYEEMLVEEPEYEEPEYIDWDDGSEGEDDEERELDPPDWEREPR